MMTNEQFRNQQRKARELQQAEAADREQHPWLYQTEQLPAVWDRGDLWEGDHQRDLGT